MDSMTKDMLPIKTDSACWDFTDTLALLRHLSLFSTEKRLLLCGVGAIYGNHYWGFWRESDTEGKTLLRSQQNPLLCVTFFFFFNKERSRRTKCFIDYRLWKYKLQIGTEKSREIQLSPYILHEGPSWSTSTCPPTYTITFVYLPRIAKN
jgi:hypothetical protein